MSRLCCLVLCLSAIGADESAKTTDAAKQRAAEAMKVAKSHALEYDIYVGKGRDKKLTLHSEPILRFTNPVPQETDAPSAELYGGVFVWTLNGRPEVIASIFKWYVPYKHISHELQSLSLGKVTAFRASGRYGTRQPQGSFSRKSPTDPKWPRLRDGGTYN